MRKPEPWMQMPLDERILEILASDLLLSPVVIAKNIEYSRPQTNTRLSELTKRGYVERPERGYYCITEEGMQYLDERNRFWRK